MRALNVHTLRLENIFPDGDTPPNYAILSHRWEKDIRDEVLYDDLKNITNPNDMPWAVRQKKGFAKVVGACIQAAKFGYDHIWIDSCCINQESSAELSESINSMYRFYQDAQVCYAFLSGLSADADLDTDEGFASHEWFTRGWTLQELIAPTNMKFFTEEDHQPGQTGWVCLGDKAAICDRLSTITSINAAILSHKQQVDQASVANRMSWAAGRTTTKPEDRAYSLMGLFGVNMPMIYGEGGTKAFLRLQEEIIKVSSDQSIFAWRNLEAKADEGMGIFATSPEFFADSGAFFGYYDWEGGETFTITNRGLRIPLPIRLVEKDLFVAALNCASSEGTGGFEGIYLRSTHKMATQQAGSTLESCERVRCDRLVPIKSQAERGTNTTLLVRASGPRTVAPVIFPDHILQLRRGPSAEVGWTLYGVMGLKVPNGVQPLRINTTEYNPLGVRTSFQLPKAQWSLAAVIVFSRPDESKVTFLIGSGEQLGDINIQAINSYYDQDFGYWKLEYGPDSSQSWGDPYNFGRELVFMDTDWLVNFSHKYHFIDFQVVLNPDYEDDSGTVSDVEETGDHILQKASNTSGRTWKSRIDRLVTRSKTAPLDGGRIDR